MNNINALSHHILDKVSADVNVSDRLNSWLDPLIARDMPSEALEGIAPEGHQNILGIKQESLRWILGRLVVKQAPKDQIEWFLKSFRDHGLAYYRLVFNQGEFVPFSINQHHYDGFGKPTDFRLNLDDWVLVFACCLILQDYSGAYELCELNEAHIDLDARQNGPSNRAFDKAMLNLLKGILYPDADMNALLVDAAEKIFKPECVGHEERQEAVNYKFLPLIPLIHAMYSPNRETAYPEKLQAALQDHKDYFSQHHPFDAQNWFAMTITGLAALAYHRWGLEPQIETLYMPEWIVKEPNIDSKRKTYRDVFGDQYDD
ncbi:Imm49 family immunity protein [Photobacterium sp. 2_MG-2023]|uniref:Imm49 family immunity protein n=1 Tax=Photobacterium sp. 2_MG-2023 TaxID=3062663 RepID=UPI0026E2CADC|nr:Imm49 family immunity protein [Photobacterium sp. 2_MG-2023]MDO6582143.1 Imm49 family immunity protein [Photobacterium sp. 2_MG-2023]